MYVCVCMAVTEQQIHEAARRGARTLHDLRRDLGVASECGSCATFARECLKKGREPRPSPAPAKRPAS
ncbi:(2Fe-2S)-binding protein [Accumulibacter sp.]|uniref:(2Fe-2S)-binding protein n=1 Tax=Accumulibacter sp. TaxID=2053492 RepID=UPI002600705F|nr:(2Fe-2S)-binding protein [Accumulibacter sp.]MCM8612955.1 (2Fe-2S)-binding protein [Accumulibacter sp.]MCM8636586.1 (2Fe-2S)-binding protein [Accumulibacter sp.]MCM8641763.1 (2Fe-2S)-binding protein [Accumulibacter sp.]